MSAQPNLLGYAILAAFAGAAVYAVTRKSVAAQCSPVTAQRVSHFSVAADTAIVWFDKEKLPPPAVVNIDDRITFPGLPGPTFAQPLIVITSDEKFWRYEGRPGTNVEGVPAPDARNFFCALG